MVGSPLLLRVVAFRGRGGRRAQQFHFEHQDLVCERTLVTVGQVRRDDQFEPVVEDLSSWCLVRPCVGQGGR